MLGGLVLHVVQMIGVLLVAAIGAVSAGIMWDLTRNGVDRVRRRRLGLR
jgi:hypothetical protein